MVYKRCVVPQCTNTWIKSPGKVFISVPTDRKRRKMFLQLARRDPNTIKPHSNVFMCEDHFDMEKDTINYMKYKMGFCQKIYFTDEAVPTKFHCQEDRKRRLSDDASSRGVFHKRQRIDLVEECLQSETHTESSVKDMVPEIIVPEVKPRTEPPADAQSARNICAACRTHFDGFVYRCVQCEYQMCSACDRVGEHRDHYVLRVPEHSPPSEVESVLARVRAALQPLQLHQPPVDEDTDSAEDNEPLVEFKTEVEIKEHDPLEAFDPPEVKIEPLEVRIEELEPPEVNCEPLDAAPHRPAILRSRGALQQSHSTFEKPQSIAVHVEEVDIKVEPQDEEEDASVSAALSLQASASAAKRPAGGLAPDLSEDIIPKRGRPKKKYGRFGV